MLKKLGINQDMKHLGSLEGIQEARLALGGSSSCFCAAFCAVQTSHELYILIYAR